MTSPLSPSCPTTEPGHDAPDCSKHLVLRECLDRWQREAHIGYLDTGRYRCRYVVWGRGPALVMIPGLASDAISFVMLMARLQSQFCCISYDLPEGGEDGARVTSYQHDDLVHDHLALLDHLRIDECVLLGFSFGSTIALSAMKSHPARFLRAILLGGFACRPLAPAEKLCASFGRFMRGSIRRLPFIERLLVRNHRQPFLAREPAVWDFFRERNLRTPLSAFATRMLMVHRFDFRALLPSIRQPVLLVSGDQDPIVSKQCETELKRGLPCAASAEIEQCGHHAHLTHPEVLAEIVQQFALGNWSVTASRAP